MITKDELAGIIDVVGAATIEEICLIVQELAEIRRLEAVSSDYVDQLCESALGEHLIETISSEEVTGVDVSGGISGGTGGVKGGCTGACMASNEVYYISGPNAFPDIPFELSEIFDILELSKREVDMGKVAKSISSRLKQRTKKFNDKIDSFFDESASDGDIIRLEKYYSDLLNLYYDYDFWLPGEMLDVKDRILNLSGRLEQLKSAQAI